MTDDLDRLAATLRRQLGHVVKRDRRASCRVHHARASMLDTKLNQPGDVAHVDVIAFFLAFSEQFDHLLLLSRTRESVRSVGIVRVARAVQD